MDGSPTSLKKVFSNVLKRHVHLGMKNGITSSLVNYAQVRRDPDFLTYLDSLSSANASSLSYPQYVSFYINSFNAMALKLVAGNPCKTRLGKFCWAITSIYDISLKSHPIFRKFYELPVGMVSGSLVSLQDIHQILLGLGDARVLVALNSAAISCPDLRAVAYEAGDGNEEEQMEKMNSLLVYSAKAFFANPQKGLSYNTAADSMAVSTVLKLNSQIIEDQFGTLQQFVKQFAPGSVASLINNATAINFLKFDWALNSNI